MLLLKPKGKNFLPDVISEAMRETRDSSSIKTMWNTRSSIIIFSKKKKKIELEIILDYSQTGMEKLLMQGSLKVYWPLSTYW